MAHELGHFLTPFETEQQRISTPSQRTNFTLPSFTLPSSQSLMNSGLTLNPDFSTI